MEAVPLGTPWFSIVLVMPLLVLGAWASGFQSDDYPELMKLAVIAAFAPFVTRLVAIALAVLILQPSDMTTQRTGILVFAHLLHAVIYGGLLLVATKRLVSCSWRKALLFSGIVVGGDVLVSLLINASANI
jgi:hypothetical protein